MTNDQEGKTQALLEELGTEMTKCPKCKGLRGFGSNDPQWDGSLDTFPCDNCNEDGEVPLFDGLRKDCPCLGFEDQLPDGINHACDLGGCKPCNQRAGARLDFHDACTNDCVDGKVLADVDVVALMAAAEKQGLKCTLETIQGGFHFSVISWIDNAWVLLGEAWEDEATDALAAALHAAVQARKVMTDEPE